MRRKTSGAGNVGLHSILRNRALGVAVGAVLMAVGAWGMIFVGSYTLDDIEEGRYSSERGKVFEMNAYVFLFSIVAGLVIMLYSAVSIQAENARSQMANSPH